MAISANAIPGDINRGLDAGFFRYLTKPIVISEFMDALNMALELSTARAEHAPIKETIE
jgi:CheY-like chemotaxis protein